MIACTGSRGGKFLGEGGKLFGERCGKEATYTTPSGPLCDGCAEAAMASIREGSCLLAMLADQHRTPREKLLAQFRRIQ